MTNERSVGSSSIHAPRVILCDPAGLSPPASAPNAEMAELAREMEEELLGNGNDSRRIGPVMDGDRKLPREEKN